MAEASASTAELTTKMNETKLADAAAPNEGDAQPSKKPNSKDLKAAKKAERAAQRGQAAAVLTRPEEGDPLGAHYGDPPLIQSQTISGRVWHEISDITPELEGQKVWVRGRVHTSRGKGKSCFVILRQRTATIQATLFVDDTTVSKGMVKYATQIPRESILDICGVVVVPKDPIAGCTQQQVELKVEDIFCISRAALLPFEVIDASRTVAQLKDEDSQFATVTVDTRLDKRYIDLRTPLSQSIFKIQSGVCQLFRELLLSEGFQEIHSPKLLGGASEGGASVFRLDYMGRPACLAQSPQFYKQMALCADFNRVFEIGPVFRAEKSFTHRHLCEFTGLDFEMTINEHYNEVLDIIDRVFIYIFNGLKSRFAHELSVINDVHPFEPLQYLPQGCRLTFAEGIQMLQDAGFEADPFGDLTTELERELGKIVKAKYKTDFYILYKYPLEVRPFYTMPDPEDPRYSNSYDVFIRGEEIISGAQRVHDPKLLEERAKHWQIPLDSIEPYIDSFRYGAPPHGGAGVGMERVVMLFCGLDNIRKTSMFPRDPKRLEP